MSVRSLGVPQTSGIRASLITLIVPQRKRKWLEIQGMLVQQTISALGPRWRSRRDKQSRDTLAAARR
jgi:hypothetical protein